MSSVTCAVRDIDSTGRHWLENFLGQPLEDNERILISVIDADQRAADGADDSWVEFDRIAAKAEARIREQGITDEEIDAAIDEAVHYVRHGKP